MKKYKTVDDFLDVRPLNSWQVTRFVKYVNLLIDFHWMIYISCKYIILSVEIPQFL